MDYSDRVNSKKGSGGVAGKEETNVNRRQRVKELLTDSIINLKNDPYVFQNHLGLLECKLCLTTHVNESSYISHIGGKKHQLNLEKRRLLDEKSKTNRIELSKKTVTISNVSKRTWTKIGTPEFKVKKIRNPQTYQLGLLVHVKYPKSQKEPLFRFSHHVELSLKNQNVVKSYLHKSDRDNPTDNNTENSNGNENSNSIQNNSTGDNYQYLIISSEPYDNICLLIPNKEIDGIIDELSDKFWWYWDNDTKQFYIQIIFK